MPFSTSSLLRAFCLSATLASPLAAIAAPKTAAANAALVAAVQAVSPDPLGGRLGLAATSTRNSDTRSDRTVRAEQTAMIEADRKAYSAWKASRKS